jgi:hypothetical protein
VWKELLQATGGLSRRNRPGKSLPAIAISYRQPGNCRLDRLTET